MPPASAPLSFLTRPPAAGESKGSSCQAPPQEMGLALLRTFRNRAEGSRRLPVGPLVLGGVGRGRLLSEISRLAVAAVAGIGPIGVLPGGCAGTPAAPVAHARFLPADPPIHASNPLTLVSNKSSGAGCAEFAATVVLQQADLAPNSISSLPPPSVFPWGKASRPSSTTPSSAKGS